MLPLIPHLNRKSTRKTDSNAPKAVHTEFDEEEIVKELSENMEALALIVTLCYLYSRVILIVLACIAFGEAPVGIYKEGSWTTFLPHL